MTKQTVCILGNSVPLLIQPPRENAREMTYDEHLREMGYVVINGSKQSAMVSDMYKYLEDECIRHFPDYVVIHFGIVECTYRARSRRLQNFFSMNAWNNSVIQKGYNGSILRGVKFVAKKMYKSTIEKMFFSVGIKWRWLKPKDFQFVMRDIIKRIFSDTPAKKVILVNMPSIADWAEKHAPGTQKSIREYNKILSDVAQEYENIVNLDMGEIFKDYDASLVSRDGIHFTSLGHRLLAEKMKDVLKGEREKFSDWKKINQYEKLYGIYANWNKRQASRSK